MRAQKKVTEGHPDTPPKACSVVTDPRVLCEGMCDRTLNQMLFQLIYIHVGRQTRYFMRIN